MRYFLASFFTLLLAPIVSAFFTGLVIFPGLLFVGNGTGLIMAVAYSTILISTFLVGLPTIWVLDYAHLKNKQNICLLGAIFGILVMIVMQTPLLMATIFGFIGGSITAYVTNYIYDEVLKIITRSPPGNSALPA